MLETKDFLLINTHTPYDVEIESTDAHFSLDSSGAWITQYPEEKGTKMMLYCRSGYRSTLAAAELAAAGYTQIYHLDGGIRAWNAAGLPLVETGK